MECFKFYMKKIINIFGTYDFLTAKIKKNLSDDYFFQALDPENSIKISKSFNVNESFKAKLACIELISNLFWSKNIPINKEELYNLSALILANANILNCKNIIWAEGHWFSEFCKFLFSQFNIEYEIMEYGPFKDTFFCVKEGLFLRNKIKEQEYKKVFNQEEIEKFIEDEKEKNTYNDRLEEKNVANFLNFKKERPYIVFFAPYSKWLEWTKGFNKFASLEAIIEHVVTIHQKSELSKSHNLIIKLHPADNIDFNKYKNMNILFLNNLYNTKKIIEMSDLVITMQSKIIFEALLFYKKIINIGKFPYELKNIVYEVDSLDEIKSKFSEILNSNVNKDLVAQFINFLRNNLILDLNNKENIKTKLSTNLNINLDFFDLKTNWTINFSQQQCKENLANKEEQINGKEAIIQELNKGLALKDNEMIEFKKIIFNKEEQINGKEAIIQELNKGLELKGNEISKLNKGLELKGNEISKLNKGLELKGNEISKLKINLDSRAKTIDQQHELIESLNVTIKEKDEFKKKLDELIMAKENYIQGIEPYYLEMIKLQNSVVYKICKFCVKPKILFYDFQKGLKILKKDGLKIFIERLFFYFQGKKTLNDINVSSSLSLNEQYQIFWSKHKLSKEDIAQIKQDIDKLVYQPKISIITPVYNVAPKWLNKCIQSVLNQYYSNWELCLHDDASTNLETIKCLKTWLNKDKRIKISFGKENQHISGASNEAIKLATGEFVAILDNDDLLGPEAFYEVVKTLNQDPKIDFIYSDEDKIDENEQRLDPFFKPDFSIDLFHSVNYICHLSVMRKSIGDKIAWFRQGFEGAQDFDLFLRFFSKTKKIKHISKILYHWRMLPTSTAKDINSKTYAHNAGIQSLKDYIKVNHIKAKIIDGFGHTNYRLQYDLPNNSLISIIIPFKDKANYLEKCITSILNKSTYKNYEIILINNSSQEKETFKYLNNLRKIKNIHIYEYNSHFNYARINNFAVTKAKGEFIVFLNNDTEVIAEDWLENLLGNANRNEVGAVGTLLLFQNKTIQHAGVVLGMTGLAGHIFAKLPLNQTYYNLVHFQRNYLALTAACLMINKKKFIEVGGFNEKFTVCGNDVDLCLKLYEKGYINVYTPYAKLYHYESMTRDPYAIPDCDFKISEQRYKPYINNDPYYNKNLSLKDTNVNINI